MYKELIKSRQLVFDVGLNMGDKSEFFLQEGSKVVGFEPLVECFENAISRFRGNQNFTAENLALDNKKGHENIYLTSYHTISSMSQNFIDEVKKERFTGYEWSNSRLVQTDTLDNMIIKYGKPDYIKIDVEGFEYNVLQGLSESIDLISVEFNPELCSETEKCIEYVDSLNNGETLFNYIYRFDEDFKFGGWLTKKEILNYIKSINDFKFEFGDIFLKKK